MNCSCANLLLALLLCAQENGAQQHSPVPAVPMEAPKGLLLLGCTKGFAMTVKNFSPFPWSTCCPCTFNILSHNSSVLEVFFLWDAWVFFFPSVCNQQMGPWSITATRISETQVLDWRDVIKEEFWDFEDKSNGDLAIQISKAPRQHRKYQKEMQRKSSKG